MNKWIIAIALVGMCGLISLMSVPDVQALSPAHASVEYTDQGTEAAEADFQCTADAANESDCFFKCGQCINKCGMNDHACKASCASIGDNCCRAYGKRMRGTNACFQCVN